MKDCQVPLLPHRLARFVALGLGAVLAFALTAYWSESLLVWSLHGLITVAALFTFSLLPRTLLAHHAIRSTFLILGGGALAANIFAATYSAGRLLLVGPWPIVVEITIVVLLAMMMFEASSSAKRLITLRDFLLLVAAVAIGWIVYEYLSVLTALLSDYLVKWLDLHTGLQYRILDAVAFTLTAIVVGASLVLMVTPFAQEPRKLAIYLAIALPVAYLIGVTSSLAQIQSVREALVSAVRIFSIVGVAFATGCLLASRLILSRGNRSRNKLPSN